MDDDLRRAEQVRDRLKELDELMGSYPEGSEMRTRLVELHIERALDGSRKTSGFLWTPSSTPAGPENPPRPSGVPLAQRPVHR